ncbi:LacI family DNA-binding transcriptional regulator [Streptomyces thermocarboxydus]
MAAQEADAGSRVTITEIARQAGVSVPTVSRVVNGRSDVSPQTRARVEDLLRRHGYRRRPASPTRPALLDLVFNQLGSPWAVEIIRGVEEEAHTAGVGTVVSAIHGRSGDAREWVRGLRARASDGVILVTSALSSLHEELSVLGVPWWSWTRTAPRSGRPHHRRRQLVRGPRRHPASAVPRAPQDRSDRRPPRLLCSRARLDGYRAALEGAGVTPTRHSSCPATSAPRRYAGCHALLDLPEPPTAVFAASDQMALGAVEALRGRGLRVPQDMSVVGFDDLPEVRWSAPPLTTVRQPLADMGALAVRTVLRLTRGEQPDSPRVELGTDLVVRASTAPPAS